MIQPDIGIEFGIEKCAILIMKSGKRETAEGIELLSQKSIRTIGEKENYNFFRTNGSRPSQTNGDEGEKKKEKKEEQENFSKPSSAAEISSKG